MSALLTCHARRLTGPVGVADDLCPHRRDRGRPARSWRGQRARSCQLPRRPHRAGARAARPDAFGHSDRALRPQRCPSDVPERRDENLPAARVDPVPSYLDLWRVYPAGRAALLTDLWSRPRLATEVEACALRKVFSESEDSLARAPLKPYPADRSAACRRRRTVVTG